MALEDEADEAITSRAAVRERDNRHRESISMFDTEVLDCDYWGGHVCRRVVDLCVGDWVRVVVNGAGSHAHMKWVYWRHSGPPPQVWVARGRHYRGAPSASHDGISSSRFKLRRQLTRRSCDFQAARRWGCLLRAQVCLGLIHSSLDSTPREGKPKRRVERVRTRLGLGVGLGPCGGWGVVLIFQAPLWRYILSLRGGG